MESPRSEKDKNLLRETSPYQRPTRINRTREDSIAWALTQFNKFSNVADMTTLDPKTVRVFSPQGLEPCL